MTTSKRCPDCAGEGEIILYMGLTEGPLATASTPCYPCGGRGWITVEEAAK